MDRIFAFMGALGGLLSVVLGAFGAHALKGRISPELGQVFETGVRYQMYHALALFACAWVLARWQSRAAATAGWLFVGGTVVFSGTLYLLAAGGPRWLGAVTPLGGTALIAGWGALAWAVLRTPR